MKLNKIFMALAATAIVGCTSEDVSDFTATQAIEDSNLIELTPDFAIAGVGVEGGTTRTHWDMVSGSLVNKFLPIWATAPAGGNVIYDITTKKDANLEAQAVGLCWLGQVPGAEVYTNYQFYHFGWLNVGEEKANFECGKLLNGSTYDEITVVAGDAAGDEADEANFTLPAKSATTGLNYNSGVYKTDNKAIFGGQYIVYYPFNENFKDAGTIPAVAETVFGDPAGTGVSTKFDTKELGKATFRYSAPVTIEGGDQAADFGLFNLSTLVQLKVALPAGDAASGTKNIDQIVLYSASQKLLKQANLAADKIVAGKKGAELYASTEGTKTIVANFPTGGVALNASDATPTSAYITVLPTTVDDLVVLVHNVSDGKWARVNMGSTEFKAGSAKVLNIPVTLTDFQAEYIAVDEASLTQALTEARNEVIADPTATPAISVIGDITVAAGLDINNANDANITIKGDAIIVPQDATLRLNTNMESDVRVLGKSCCTGTLGGRLVIQGGTVNNVTMEPTEVKKELTTTEYNNYNPLTTYNTGTATIAAGKTFDVQAGRVVVRNAVEHKGNIKIAEGASLTVDGTGTYKGDIQFMGSNVTNDGTIEVLKGGKYDMTDANGNATATDGQRMTNNGKFIHNVDAGVGTAVQSMAQNGEYRCKVDDQIKLDDAFLQWTACSVIEMVNTGAKSYNLGTAASIATPYQHNGKYIDIEVNAGGLTTFTNPTPDANIINIGNLTVTAGGLDIDYTNTVSGTTASRSLAVNGDMAVAANTTITDSKKITVTKNLTVEGAGVTLAYKGAKKNVDGLAVTGDITVSGATFDAGSVAADVDALNITCANFYLKDAATAVFGNRTDGAAKNLVVSGTISNPTGCTFNIVAANQNGAGSVLAWVTCKKLEVGGTFSAARPRVE